MPRSFSRLGVAGGEAAAVLGHYLLGGAVHVAGPRVVAQALPVAQHLGLGGGGQGVHRRVGRQEGFVVGKALGHAGLLENDFGQPNGVGVAGVAPGQVALVARVPGQQRGGQKGGLEGLFCQNFESE